MKKIIGWIFIIVPLALLYGFAHYSVYTQYGFKQTAIAIIIELIFSGLIIGGTKMLGDSDNKNG